MCCVLNVCVCCVVLCCVCVCVVCVCVRLCSDWVDFEVIWCHLGWSLWPHLGSSWMVSGKSSLGSWVVSWGVCSGAVFGATAGCLLERSRKYGKSTQNTSSIWVLGCSLERLPGRQKRHPETADTECVLRKNRIQKLLKTTTSQNTIWSDFVKRSSSLGGPNVDFDCHFEGAFGAPLPQICSKTWNIRQNQAFGSP